MKLLWLTLSAAAALAQIKTPLQTPEDVARGRRLFESQCTGCHGQTAEGGRGPSLRQARLRRVTDDASLFDVIRDGIPGTEMPGMWYLSEREIRQVAGYLRDIAKTPIAAVSGDAARGRNLFEGGGGCLSCHIAAGKGVAAGPDLTDIGARRSVAHLRESLTAPAGGAPDGFLLVDAVAGGRTVSGVRVNEDTFTIQIRDAAGRFHSFRKSALASLKRREGESSMPSYSGKLTAAELDDLVAYLAGLRGEP
jgi:cytochrome c oxidase cbb3-type subunit III